MASSAMSGASAARHSPATLSPSSLDHHRGADCRSQTSIVSRISVAKFHRKRLVFVRARPPQASVRFNSISIGSQCNTFHRFSKLGFSLAASSNDWASVGTKSSEEDPDGQGWTNSSGDRAQASVNADTSKATAEPERDGGGEPTNKFMGVLRDTTEELKEHAGKARAAFAATAQETAAALAATAQETAEKSKENLSYIAENAPDPIREIADTALKAHSADTPKKFAKIHDFCLGIPYGTILMIGGFLWFVFTGTTSPIRFGVILGGVLLALSVTSLSAWKEGKPTITYIIGQAAISAIFALRQIRKLWEVKVSFSALLFTLVSSGMLAFYCYVLLAGGNPPSKKTKDVPAV